MLNIRCNQKRLPKTYLSRERLALKIIGISLTGNEGKAYKIYSLTVTLLFGYVYLVLHFLNMVREVTQNRLDRETFIYLFATLLGTLKAIVVLKNRIRIRNILDKLEKEPLAVNEEDEDNDKDRLIKECVYYTNAQSYVYWVTLFMAILPAQLDAVIKRITSDDYHDWILPYGFMYPINVTYSPNFEICLLHQTLSIHYFGWAVVAIDLITASILCHLCYQFKYLQNKFRKLIEDSFKKMMEDNHSVATASNNFTGKCSTVPWKYLRKSLKEAVEYHLTILDIAEEMEKIFNGLLLVVCFATLSMMGIMVYRSSMLPLNDPELVRSVSDTIVSGMQILVVCYWGEQVIHESSELGRAAYETDFVGTDIRFQKSLILIIRRSQIPTRLTIGKFNNACIATFTWVLQSTYTAFMLLRNSTNPK